MTHLSVPPDVGGAALRRPPPPRVLLLALLIAAGCGAWLSPSADAGAAGDPHAAPATAPVAGARVAAGQLQVGPSLARYLVVLPAGGDATRVSDSLQAAAAARIAEGAGRPGLAGAAATVKVIPFAFPLELLGQFGMRLDPPDVAGLGGARDAVRIEVRGPGGSNEVQQLGAELAQGGAAGAGGWVVDLWTLQVWSPSGFAAQRPAGFPKDVWPLVSVHSVRGFFGLSGFLETAGLARFGLPELLLRDVPADAAEDLHLLVCATAQTLLEHPTLPKAGRLHVDLRDLRAGDWPARASLAELSGGTGVLDLGLRWSGGEDHEAAPAEPGGAPSLYLELELPGRGSAAERAEVARGALRGRLREQALTSEADPEVSAAYQHARAAFALLAPRLAEGVPAGENLIVKSRFEAPTGEVEWMWIEVDRVTEGQIHGTLLDEPWAKMSVHKGDRLSVPAAEIGDYVWVHADGSTEGGELERLLQRRGG